MIIIGIIITGFNPDFDPNIIPELTLLLPKIAGIYMTVAGVIGKVKDIFKGVRILSTNKAVFKEIFLP